MREIDQLRAEVLALYKENRELRLAQEATKKRHLTVADVSRLYGYTQGEIRRMALQEGKLRFIPAGKVEGNAYRRIKFDRYALEEDFRDLMIVSKERRSVLSERNRPQRAYVHPNLHKYL